jgi:hypothetical protein
MWCPTCQADVAAELSPDHRRLSCARCRTELALAATEPARSGGVRMTGVERNARELLARWSAETQFEPPTVSIPTRAAETPVESPISEADEDGSAASTDSLAPTTEPTPTILPALTFVEALFAAEPTRRRKGGRKPARVEPVATPWMATVGLFTAYAGVGGLTCGAALVLWSYFGGPAHFAASGWLVMTLGQMLLFLGLVTLVAGNLERMHAESEQRLREFAGQVRRLEKSLRRSGGRAEQSEAAPRPHRDAA